VLRPYRGEPIIRQIPVKIPTSTPKGTLRILVSDGDTLDRAHRVVSNFGRKLELDQTITLLNNEHVNHSLYVSLLENSPQALVQEMDELEGAGARVPAAGGASKDLASDLGLDADELAPAAADAE